MGFDSASRAPPAAALAPGFRFHPTDEELVWYYLKRKVLGRAFLFDAINEIDVYKSEPWDLPGKSRLKSRDLEWYFFSMLDKKYGNGSRTNRATEKGYWKTTGKDRPVLHKSRTVGMKKTLVYHRGRAPRGERTNWVMHEYKLVDEVLGKSQDGKDAFVLCRIFQKSGSGPKNGEQYGAPLIEEEWEDDELVMIAGEETAEEVPVESEAYLDDNDAYLDGNDIEQILGADIPSEDVPLPLSFYYEDNAGSSEERLDFVNNDQKLLADAGTCYHTPDQPDAQILFNLPVENGVVTRPVKREYIGEPSNMFTAVDADYFVDEPFLGAIGNTASDDRASVEANNLFNPIEADPSSFDMLDEYLAYCAANDDNSQFIAFDSSTMLESENTFTEQAFLTQKCNDGETQQETMGRQELVQRHDKNVPSTSKQGPGDSGLDIKYPCIKQASCMLGSIPAPAAFASEFPQKDAALQLNSTSHSSSSIHVTAGMIQITDLTLSPNGTHWPLGKHMGLSFIISYNVPYNDVDYAFLDPMDGTFLGKAGSTMSRGWFYLILIWVLILSISLQIGTCVYSGNAS